MIYVLIVLTGAGYTSGGFSVEFKTREACEVAQKELYRQKVPFAGCYAK
jgi:hypothetical protein